MEFKVSEEFQKHLMLDDIRDYHPGYDPYVFIARSWSKKETIEQLQGTLESSIHIKAFTVPVEQKEIVLGKVSYEDVLNDGKPYFEDEGNYVTGETFEYDGALFEKIVNNRFFEGLGLGYYEPAERLILYLNLHREGNNWDDLHNNDIIIKAEGTTRGWEPHDTYLSIRKSDLIDYLAARKCGLLLLRYAECILETPVQLIRLPEPFNDKLTKSGRQSWIVDRAPSNRDNYMYFSRLWESFWIDPAASPRRWDAKKPEEFKDGVAFILGDGETTTYKQDGKDRYFELLSFKTAVFKSFLSLPNSTIKFDCLSNLFLRYADGASFTGCINREGQFQTFFGSIAKLDVDKQRNLAAFSEPRMAKPSYEFFRTQIEAKFPETLPFCWTLANCLEQLNVPWQQKYSETLLLSPREDQIPIFVQVGPTSDDYDELTDIMLELQKTVIPEARIDTIKVKLDYSSSCPDANAYRDMRSIGYTRLLFRVNRPDETEAESHILQLINELRNCKGHPKDVIKTLEKHGMPITNPRVAYLSIMADFCSFLLAFRMLTEKLLAIEVGINTAKVDDPWKQMEIAQRYFREPF